MYLIINECLNMMLSILLLMVIATIPMAFMAAVIFMSKKIKKDNIMRSILAKVYKALSIIHNCFLVIVLLVFFFRIAKLFSIILIVLFASVKYMLNGSYFMQSQLDFMLLTMMIVFYYPISILVIKYFTYKQYKEENNEKVMAIAIFNAGIKFTKKVPIEEIINVGYVLFLIYSSIIKLETNDTGFDSNYVYLSFIIYLAINTSATIIYKKHKKFFDDLDNHFFKTDLIKKESVKLNVNKDLKQANKYGMEFILTGEVPKEAKKFFKRTEKYIK